MHPKRRDGGREKEAHRPEDVAAAKVRDRVVRPFRPQLEAVDLTHLALERAALVLGARRRGCPTRGIAALVLLADALVDGRGVARDLVLTRVVPRLLLAVLLAIKLEPAPQASSAGAHGG